MEKVLLLHSSSDGQTIKIMRHIEASLGEGYQCELVDLNQLPDVEFSRYDRALIGASIRYGHLNKALYQFIAKHQSALAQHKVGFFCVNLTARKEGKNTPETSVYIKKFLQKSAWRPELMGVFAGALRYPRYKWFDRVMIQFIMRLTGGETDTSKEVEYTDWQKVAAFAGQFKAL
ncbi:menaquinone-dependent protoporphyrinogen IX dehydrogenase [Photobacterium ganghwense]|uniref:Protoporphyrinogen IX dehydrogenase [quinone] n=1 Tax=Photobacterium ganghwense TaxID=320778 RepID=A0A0J1GZJ1_9GAMM|nr:menaquinone-dependent protoporphyrinogen IX dehydrogenase [Photobacterium ganghwense]KLV05066.1 protoporphyrinogen oxidase [Photobacterium ganghwense]PSU04372.1 menaquinone-dependent protoporphyrinogen IX dehydrogenase [Photobacterium ganghwense]QSV14131.1 menaquinone-dependent protoporphyrinogen IX dehydrogenase [Photobacterium ganghwense]